MDLKEKTRERDSARFFATDTLRMALDWIEKTNPQNYLGKEAKEAIGEAAQAKMREWVDKAGDLMDKTWVLADMLVDDAVKVLTEFRDAHKAATPQDK